MALRSLIFCLNKAEVKSILQYDILPLEGVVVFFQAQFDGVVISGDARVLNGFG